MDIEQFLADRKQALLSMDQATIEAYMEKYEVPRPSGNRVFWLMVHKARTGDTTLPMFERAASKEWLRRAGSRSMDDGDVLPPTKPAEAKRYFDRLKEWGIE